MSLELSTGLALFETARNSLKLMIDGKSALDQASLRLQLVEVATQLGRAQLEHQEALRNLDKLASELTRLRDALAIKGDVTRFGNAVFLKEGEAWSLPYCLTCWQRESRLLSLLRSQNGPVIRWRCPTCRVDLQPGDFPDPRA